ncbi:hypothetical protein Bbelb_048840 [Branchiostoma belcheri]|nr:hypothetical protein Bbelb_048840 [Branchiostoma belcheri]
MDVPVKLTKYGNRKPPTKTNILEWLMASWEDLPSDIVQRSFRKAGISLAMDGSQDEEIDMTRGGSLGLRSAYMQVLLEESAREKTAFTTPFGLFQYKRLPFGLCSAPSTFARLMENVLRGLQPHTCLTYLDDNIVHSDEDIANHLANLEAVFQYYPEANLKLNPEKCKLARALGGDMLNALLNISINGPPVNSPESTRMHQVVPRTATPKRSGSSGRLWSAFARLAKSRPRNRNPRASTRSKTTKWWNVPASKLPADETLHTDYDDCARTSPCDTKFATTTNRVPIWIDVCKMRYNEEYGKQKWSKSGVETDELCGGPSHHGAENNKRKRRRLKTVDKYSTCGQVKHMRTSTIHADK